MDCPYASAVIVGVSGGVDSVTLADMLHRQGTVGFAVAHCNFHLRGEESDGDAEFVRNWAAERGVRFHSVDFDTKAYAGSRKISIEMAARELRYGWFALLCREYGYGAVAIAHNANDNAETLILNLVRGTGLRGICGMQEVSVQAVSPVPGLASALGCGESDFPETLNIWRPFLGMTRSQIEGYARKHGLKWREDRTNKDSEYKRNLVRNEIIPLLERLNPSVVKVLNRDMKHFAEIGEIVDAYFGDWDADSQVFRPKSSEELCPPDAVGCLRQDGPHSESALLERIVTRGRGWRYALYLFLERYSFSGAVIAQVENLLESGRTVSGKTFLSPTHRLIMSRSSLILEPLNLTAEPLKPIAAGNDGVSCRPDICGDDSGVSSGVSVPGREEMVERFVHGREEMVERFVPGREETVERFVHGREETAESLVKTPGEYRINGCTVKVELFDRPADYNPRQPEGVTAVDADKVGFPLILRSWRDGDWMRPLGCRGKKKISDLFTDLKFSLPEKRSAILLENPAAEAASGTSAGTSADPAADPSGRVLALLGLRIDESVRITPETRRILRFTID